MVLLPPVSGEVKGGAIWGTEPRPSAPETPDKGPGGGTGPLPLDVCGSSTSMEDGAIDEGVVALLVEQGTIISKSSSCRKLNEEVGTETSRAKGKENSSNTTMARDDNMTCRHIKTTISFMGRRIAHENTCSGPRSKLWGGEVAWRLG